MIKTLRHTQVNNPGSSLRKRGLFLVSLLFFLCSGCSIWEANLDPDYKSSRADRLCHPYGQCTQGTWVAVSGPAQDPMVAKDQCNETVAQRFGDGEWDASVAKGLEIGRCMEKKGYRLQQ